MRIVPECREKLLIVSGLCSVQSCLKTNSVSFMRDNFGFDFGREFWTATERRLKTIRASKHWLDKASRAHGSD